MNDGGKRTVTVRLDPRLHDGLQKRAEDAGGTVTELTRALVEQALDDASSATLLVHMKAITQRLTSLERALAAATHTLGQRLDVLERLACAADAHAAQRHGLQEETISRFFVSANRHALMTHEVTAAMLEIVVPAAGGTHEQAKERYEACRADSAARHRDFQAQVAQLHAGIGARAPAALAASPRGGSGDGAAILASTVAEIAPEDGVPSEHAGQLSLLADDAP